jgi:hypothetical protein
LTDEQKHELNILKAKQLKQEEFKKIEENVDKEKKQKQKNILEALLKKPRKPPPEYS